MIDEEDYDVSVGNIAGSGERDVRDVRQLPRECVDVGFHRAHFRIREHGGDLRGDLDCRALSQVVDIGFESKPKTGDGPVGLAPERLAHLPHDSVGATVVRLPGGADQDGFLWSNSNDEPRVHSDAVAADARTGGENLDPRMVIRQGRG